MDKATLLLVTGMLAILGMSTKAEASYLSGNTYAKAANKKVVSTKSVKVYKVQTGKSEAQNKKSYFGKLKNNTVFYVSKYMMSTGGYVVKSSKYTHTKRKFFMVQGKGNHWYRQIKSYPFASKYVPGIESTYWLGQSHSVIVRKQIKVDLVLNGKTIKKRILYPGEKVQASRNFNGEELYWAGTWNINGPITVNGKKAQWTYGTTTNNWFYAKAPKNFVDLEDLNGTDARTDIGTIPYDSISVSGSTIPFAKVSIMEYSATAKKDGTFTIQLGGRPFKNMIGSHTKLISNSSKGRAVRTVTVAEDDDYPSYSEDDE